MRFFFLLLVFPFFAFDQIELKLRIDPEDIKNLGLKQKDSEKRLNYFFDDEELNLFAQGLIIRVRKRPNQKSDATVKVRPYPERDIAVWKTFQGFKAETDIVLDKGLDSCSIKRKVSKKTFNRKLAQGCSIRLVKDLFTRGQLLFLMSHMKSPVNFDNLVTYGPATVRVWDKDGWVTERWELPDGTVALELSSKTTADNEEKERDKMIAYLESVGARILENPTTKTRALFGHKN